MKEKTRETLELFIEKVEYLEDTNYVKRGKQVIGFTIKKENNNLWKIDFDLPSKEERDSFLLTFRLFIQNNDRLSFYQMVNLYRDPDLSQEWKNGHGLIRTELNTKLEEEAINSPTYGILTNRDVMEIYLYGYLGHLNQEKRSLFLSLTKNLDAKEMFEIQFHRSLIYVFNALLMIKKITQNELIK